jgi:glucose/mannose-6-phosphate isomerase
MSEEGERSPRRYREKQERKIGRNTVTAADSVNLREHILSMPDHVEHALGDATGIEGLPDRDRVESIAVIATGDDAVVGDVLQAVAAPFIPLPITVLHDYELPASVGDGTLVFAASADGDTEEIIDVTTSAVTQGASVVVLGSGQLAKEAVNWAAPVFSPPDDTPFRRSAIGYSATIPLVILNELGLFPGANEWIQQAVLQLRTRAEQLSSVGNYAEELAGAIVPSIPIFSGGGLLGSAAARRWKTSVNLSAQAPAFWNGYPEAAHSELAGWSHLEATELSETAKRRLFVVNLRHDSEHPHIAMQFAETAERVANAVVGVRDVDASGEGEFAQLLDLVLLGDMVALYMAAALGIDPGPLPT